MFFFFFPQLCTLLAEGGAGDGRLKPAVWPGLSFKRLAFNGHPINVTLSHK